MCNVKDRAGLVDSVLNRCRFQYTKRINLLINTSIFLTFIH